MAKRAIQAQKPKTLPPVRPNVGIQTAYQRKLEVLIEDLHTSIAYWVMQAYEAHPPELANDKFDKAAPADVMKRLFRRLARRWQKRFDGMAPKMAAFFADKATDRADDAMAAILKEAGWTVKFSMGPTAQDAYKAIVAENVGLIRNLSQEHLFQIEGLVMRSVQSGHDAGTLAKALQDRYAMTRRRAALIARDQNNKATAVITRVRQQELGMTQAIWQHSTAGRHPRPEHVAFNGKPYDIAKGAYLDGKWVWPGTEINCFPGDMPVRSTGNIVALWRTFFNGPMVHIYVGPDLLKGTSNHPVLTTRGWVALGSLQDGDKIVCMTHQSRKMVYDDKDDTVATFSELFESHSVMGGYVSRDAVSFDFHGERPDNKVDEIILINDDLLMNRYAGSLQYIEDFSFAESYSAIGRAICGGREHILHTDASGPSDSGFLRVGAFSGRSDEVSVGSCPHEAIAYQNISDIPSGMARGADLGGNGGGAEARLIETNDVGSECVPVPALVGGDADRAKLFAEFVSRISDSDGSVFEFGASFYEFRSVRDKRVRDFSGHVFTMQTMTGYYSIGDAFVQAKNCRCVSKPIIPGFN